MPELERELRELGAELRYPETPDLATSVRRRLAEPRRRRRPWLRRRTLTIALAVLAVALAAVLAVPPARTALLELFGLEGASIRRVDELPAVRPFSDLDLGTRVSLAQARRRVRFPVPVPTRAGYDEPDAVYVRDFPPGGLVSLLYGSEEEVRLLLTAFRGSSAPELVKKVLGAETRIEQVVVGGELGYWIEGAPHAVVFRDARGRLVEDRYRLARNVLLWERRGLLLRLEGEIERDEALRIAESLR